jgi:menaquinol-cytochrome c reductase iron-sulfur subunit
MPLIDDLAAPLDDEERTRRAFLGLLGGAAMSAACLGTGITAVRYLWPEVLFEEETRFPVGRPEEIPVGTLLALPRQKLYVARGANGFFAMTAVCTHLGCLTRYEPENARILCPCHGSRFTTEGHVAAGPAPKPLPRLELRLENGILIVDAAKPVAPDFVLKA